MSDPDHPAGDPDLRTVGVLGGMSSESTVEYYRRINERINEARGGHAAGDLVIRSVNFATVERFIREDRWAAAGEFLADAAADLAAAGAEVVVMATNTMHRVAPAIAEALSVPMVHIVDPAAEAARADGVGTVGVLGTRTTMEADFYRDRFAAHGVDVVVPGPEDRAAVDRVIFEELTKGVVREGSRETYLRVVDDLAAAGAEGVVLGCTEVELLLDGSGRPDLPFYDTTALHADRAAAIALGERPLPDG